MTDLLCSHHTDITGVLGLYTTICNLIFLRQEWQELSDTDSQYVGSTN